MSIEIEHNPHDILVGLNVLSCTEIDENNEPRDLYLISLGLLFITITLVI